MKLGTIFLLIGAVLVLLGAWLFIADKAVAPQPEEIREEQEEEEIEPSESFDSGFVSLSEFSIEIADTSEERAQGLSGRKDVPERYGLLFIFPEAGRNGFWMKDMFVSIDIIWLSEDGTIVGIEEAVSPETYPKSFYPPQPVRFVLETRAGEARRSGWSVGTNLDISNL